MIAQHQLFCHTRLSHQLYLLLPLKVFFFAWITQNIFSDSLPDYKHPWCEELLCIWSRETQASSTRVRSSPETCKLLQSAWIYWLILLLNQRRTPCLTPHPTETWLEGMGVQFWRKTVSFTLHLGVLRCTSVQAKTTQRVKLLSS